MRGYLKRVDKENPEVAANYFEKHAYIIALSGLLWGGTAYFFNYSEQNLSTVLFLLYVIAYAYSSVINYAPHYPTIRIFLISYGSGLFTAFLFAGLMRPLPQYGEMYWILVIGILLLLITIYKLGRQLNLTYFNSMLFEYRNMRLIDSLKIEKQSALNAIASKNRLIASTAHDMRQPVLALDLYANWLSEDINMAPELTPKISAATRAVITLFDAMFDLAQIKENQVKIKLIEVNVLFVLQELCDQQQIVAESKGLVLRRRLKSKSIISDPVLLKRILGNLISNALKYTNKGGVLLACRQKKQSLHIEVWDTGCGIAKQEHDLIFQEFYKSATLAGTSDGFGLGLSIVKELSQKLGYIVHMKSRLGIGTMIAIEIPLNSKNEQY